MFGHKSTPTPAQKTPTPAGSSITGGSPEQSEKRPTTTVVSTRPAKPTVANEATGQSGFSSHPQDSPNQSVVSNEAQGNIDQPADPSIAQAVLNHSENISITQSSSKPPAEPSIAQGVPKQSPQSSAPQLQPDTPAPPVPPEARGDWHDFVPRKSFISRIRSRLFNGKFIFRIVVILLVIAALAVLAGAAYIFVSRPYWFPHRIRVTNVTDRSATVSWVTDRPSSGVVVYSEENAFIPIISGATAVSTAYDDRDVSKGQLEAAGAIVDTATESGVRISQEDLSDISVNEKDEFYVHHVTLHNLDPETTYYFRVGNGVLFSIGPDQLADDEFSAIESAESGASIARFTTLSELESIPLPDPSYGSVVHASGVVSDGIVFMKPRPGSDILPLSAVLNETGNWYIDLSTARMRTGEPVDDFNEDTDAELLYVEAGEHGESGETTVPMDQDAPAPKIHIGSDITDNTAAVAQEPSAENAGEVWSAGGPLPSSSGIQNPNVIPVVPEAQSSEDVPMTHRNIGSGEKGVVKSKSGESGFPYSGGIGNIGSGEGEVPDSGSPEGGISESASAEDGTRYSGDVVQRAYGDVVQQTYGGLVQRAYAQTNLTGDDDADDQNDPDETSSEDPAAAEGDDDVDTEIGPVLPPHTEQYFVTDDYVLVPRSDGDYTIIIPSVGQANDVLLLEGEEYTFFVDENGNGEWDDEEEKIEIGEFAVELIIDDRRSVHTLDVVSGFNYLSFDYLPNKVNSCEFLEEINIRSKNSITQLARFESGMYEVTSYRRDTQDPAGGYCFPVVPGRGYVVRAYGDDSLTYQGYRLTEAAGVALDAPGWHLIGINGVSKVYTASGVIDAISGVEGLTAVNVTKWRVDASKFEGLQKEEDAQGYTQVYGFDFEIEGERGYFVKVAEGGGVWEPE